MRRKKKARKEKQIAARIPSFISAAVAHHSRLHRCAGSVCAFDTGYLPLSEPFLARYPVRGIDVSHHQGEIDWSLLNGEGIRFAFIKASEGDDHVDTRFRYNWEHAGQNGIKRGGYLFYSLRISGADQAENFIRTVPADGELPPAIDLEFGGNSAHRPSVEEFQAELAICIHMLEEHYGKKPVLYVTAPFRERYLKGSFSDHPLWLRNLVFPPDDPQMLFWQHHHRGRLRGIDGFVDRNVFNGNAEAFAVMFAQEAE